VQPHLAVPAPRVRDRNPPGTAAYAHARIAVRLVVPALGAAVVLPPVPVAVPIPVPVPGLVFFSARPLPLVPFLVLARVGLLARLG